MTYHRGMTAPRRAAAETREAILDAARAGFSTQGFERTTIRGVAEQAGVDPALVMHYFGSKQQLFVAATQLELSLPDLTGTAPRDVAARLVPYFLQVWQDDGPFLGMLRAATSHRPAAEALVALFTRQVAPAIAPLVADRPETRAALIGAQLIGIAVARSVLRVPPLLEADDAELVHWLGPVIEHHLTTPAP